VTSLKDINDVRLNTTLLSSATPLFPDLRSALVVLVIQGGKSALVKQGNPQQSSIGISLWKDYPYNTFGDQLNGETEDTQIVATSTPQGTVLAEKLATPTGRWVQQDWSEYEDAFKPVVSENIQDLSLISEPPKPPTKRARAVRGAPKPTQLAPSASLNAGSTTREPLIDYRVEPQIILKNKAIDQGQKSSRNDENRQAFQVGGAPKIEPPYMPPPTNGANLVPSPGHTIPYSMTGITNGSSHSTDWEEKVVRGARGGRLVDVQGRLPAPAKDIKETMNQKSPQRLTGSQSEMVKKFEKATRQILSLALPRQGPIRFEVGIGRLLVHPQAGISEFKRPFAATEWHSAFPIKDHSNGAMRETTFTPQLTTRSLDIESILNLKQSQGRPLFKHEPCERRVTYVISCATKHNERVIIEVCENGSFKVHGSDVLVGALEWHYPLRMWDSRLQLVTQEYKLGDYHQQAQGVVKNMKVQIPADGKTINFSTTTIDQELVVQSVLLQRETAHSATTHPDLLLHLKEVQDMSVHNVPSIENHYRGSIYVPAKMISAGILWWEASFTSITAAKVLKENEALELGEVAKWSPESIVGAGVIKDMYALADEVVTKIDHVGVYNKGPYSHSDPRTGPRTRPSPGVSDLEGLPGMGNFW